MRILLIKAGQTEAEKLNCFCMDSVLSWEGRVLLKQMGDMGREILGKTDIVISSTHKSATETAKILFPYKYTGLASNRLDEINFGTLENEKASLDILDSIADDANILRRKYNGDNVWDRADTFLAFLREIYKKKEYDQVALISHKYIIEAFRIYCEMGCEDGILWKYMSTPAIWEIPECYIIDAKGPEAFRRA